MSDRENIELFRDDLQARIDYHRAENHISYAAAIGVLCILRHELEMELYNEEREEDDSD